MEILQGLVCCRDVLQELVYCRVNLRDAVDRHQHGPIVGGDPGAGGVGVEVEPGAVAPLGEQRHGPRRGCRGRRCGHAVAAGVHQLHHGRLYARLPQHAPVRGDAHGHCAHVPHAHLEGARGDGGNVGVEGEGVVARRRAGGEAEAEAGAGEGDPEVCEGDLAARERHKRGREKARVGGARGCTSSTAAGAAGAADHPSTNKRICWSSTSKFYSFGVCAEIGCEYLMPSST
jgi:hypothetical protein